jgi:hypothetical protein
MSVVFLAPDGITLHTARVFTLRTNSNASVGCLLATTQIGIEL